MPNLVIAAGAEEVLGLLDNSSFLPHGMCYSHFGNGVRSGEISITQRGSINDY